VKDVDEHPRSLSSFSSKNSSLSSISCSSRRSDAIDAIAGLEFFFRPRFVLGLSAALSDGKCAARMADGISESGHRNNFLFRPIGTYHFLNVESHRAPSDFASSFS
jgi:hypothetical protein